MRRLILLVLLLLAVPAASASALTVTGSAELKLDRPAVRAAGAAKVVAGKLTVPAFSGRVTATSAALTHSGVVQVKGKNLTGLRTVLGTQSKTTALLDGKRRALFTYGGTTDFADGSATLANAPVTLAKGTAKALKLKPGRVGRATIRAAVEQPAAQGVTWRPRESFIRYINSEDGGTEVSGGAQNGPEEVRPGTDAALVYSFVFPDGTGAVRFFWQARGIDLTFADPRVVGTKFVVTHAGQPLELLDLTPSGTDGTFTATLTQQGADVFVGFYAPGDEFGSVTVAAAPAATARIARAAAAKKRIVALSPFTANTLAALGNTPIGVANTLGGQDRFSSKLADVPRLELSHPNGPNLEQLAALDPDVVLSSSTWSRGHAAMRELGMKVVLADPGSVDGIPAATRKLGKLVGRTKQADRIARRQAAEARSASAGISERPRTLVVLGVGRSPYAFLPSSWGGDLITRAGAELLTEGLSGDGGFARISDEVVLARDPDIIIAVPHGNAKDIPSIEQYMRSNPIWEQTSAGQNDRVYIAKGNTLLQPFTDVGRMIRDMRTLFLKN